IPKNCSPFRCARSDECILCRRDAGLIQKYVSALEFLERKSEQSILERVIRSELLESKKVRIESAAPDDISSWRRQHYLATAREERCGQKNRRANLRAQTGVEVARGKLVSFDSQRVRSCPLRPGAHGLNQFNQSFDIPDVRNVLEMDRLL